MDSDRVIAFQPTPVPEPPTATPLPAAVTQPNVNLLPNPSFESGTTKPDGWFSDQDEGFRAYDSPTASRSTFIKGEFGKAEWDDGQAYTGNRSLKFPPANLPGNFKASSYYRTSWNLALPITYDANKNYVVELWCMWKKSPSAFDTFGIGVDGLDETGHKVIVTGVVTEPDCGIGEWGKVEGTLEISRPGSVVPVQVLINISRLAGSGHPVDANLWVDDIRLSVKE